MIIYNANIDVTFKNEVTTIYQVYDIFIQKLKSFDNPLYNVDFIGFIDKDNLSNINLFALIIGYKFEDYRITDNLDNFDQSLKEFISTIKDDNFINVQINSLSEKSIFDLAKCFNSDKTAMRVASTDYFDPMGDLLFLQHNITKDVHLPFVNDTIIFNDSYIIGLKNLINRDFLNEEFKRIQKIPNLRGVTPNVYCIIGFDSIYYELICRGIINELYKNNKCDSTIFYSRNGAKKLLSLERSQYLFGVNVEFYAEDFISKKSKSHLTFAEKNFSFNIADSYCRDSNIFIAFHDISEFNIFLTRYFGSTNHSINKFIIPIINSEDYQSKPLSKEEINNIVNETLSSFPMDTSFISIENILSYADSENIIKDKNRFNKTRSIINFIINNIYEHFYKDYLEIHNKTIQEIQNKNMKNISSEINDLIGLEDAKKQISDIIKTGYFQKNMQNKGLHYGSIASMNFVFYGKPGTGKTTVATIYADMMAKANLRNTKLKITGRGELVGKYVGWTAAQIKEIFEEYEGGIIFIDEAYSLITDLDKGYGQEAVNTLVECMDIYRDNTTVILAGYDDKMKEFINANPGLKSRISFYINFPDYSLDELVEIAKYIADNDFNFTITKNGLNQIREICKDEMFKKNFGNARFVRNLIDKAYIKHACRYSDSIKDYSIKSLTTLTKEDFMDLNLKDVVYDPPKSGF